MRTDASSLEEQVGIAAMIGIFIAAAAFLECPDPILKLPVLKVSVLLGLAFHEFAHGAAAKALGDTTAADEGRLTLNPLKHLHPVGTLLILAFGIGWARPVSVAADDVRFGRWGLAGVALAGPLANLTICLGCVPIYFRALDLPAAGVADLVDQVVLANLLLFGFNIFPVHPVDGGKVLRAFVLERWLRPFDIIGYCGGICVVAFVFSTLFIERIAEGPIVLIFLAPFSLALAVISVSTFGLLRRLLAWMAVGCERALGMSRSGCESRRSQGTPFGTDSHTDTESCVVISFRGSQFMSNEHEAFAIACEIDTEEAWKRLLKTHFQGDRAHETLTRLRDLRTGRERKETEAATQEAQQEAVRRTIEERVRGERNDWLQSRGGLPPLDPGRLDVWTNRVDELEYVDRFPLSACK